MNGFNGANGPAPDGNGVFGPEAVDEQIALRMAPGAPADAETRLVRDLATVYAMPRGESEAALARVRARVMAGQATAGTPTSRYVGGARDMSDAQDKSGAHPEWQPPTSTTARGRGHARGWLAGAALVIIVALMGVLFHGLTTGRTANPPAHGTPTPEHTATANPSPSPSSTNTSPSPHAPWQVVETLPSEGSVALAPSDPQVEYSLVVGVMCKACQPQADLKQTTDAGQHWTERTLPALVTQDPTQVIATLYVSPLDPQTVILAGAGDFGASCPANPQASIGNGNSGQFSEAMPAAGTHCALHFRSTDGGLHWQQIALPAPGFMGGAVLNQHAPALEARGSALYATINPQLPATSGVTPGARLVESQDGGATWRLIDGDIASAKQAVFDYAALPGSATIFAVTDVAGFQDVNYIPHYELWRSDDDGAHWQRNGTLPAPTPFGMVATTSAGGTTGILYMAAGTAGSATALTIPPATPTNSVRTLSASILLSGPGYTANFYASTDGGQHWVVMPSAGVDAGLKLAQSPVGLLSDGSVIVPFSDGGITAGGTTTSYYAWKLGQSEWRRLGPPLDNGLHTGLALVVSDGPAGSAALWVTVSTDSESYLARLPLAGS